MENGIIKRKNTTGFIITIIILFLMVAGLSGFIVYDKVLSRSVEKSEDITTTTTTKQENNNDPVGRSTTTTKKATAKTTLICNSDEIPSWNEAMWSYTVKVEFTNDVLTNYENIDTYKYENAKIYNAYKKDYLSKNFFEFDDNNLIIREFEGFEYGMPIERKEGFKTKTLEQMKNSLENSQVGITVCTIQNQQKDFTKLI